MVLKQLDPADVAAYGHFTWTTRDAETGQIHEEAEGSNLITTNGLLYLAGTFVYNTVLNQNSGWGSPLPSTYANLGNCYGLVGTSSTAPASSDLALGNEVARALISNAAVVGSTTIELDFFFGTAFANQTITEGGVCVSGTSNPATLTAALVQGTNYTALTCAPYLLLNFNGTPSSIPAGTFLLIGYGNATPTQYCQVTATVNNGATTIPIAAVGGGTFTANANYPIGTLAMLGPNGTGQPNPSVNGGILFDHSVFSTSTTKNSSETATLALQINLTSP